MPFAVRVLLYRTGRRSRRLAGAEPETLMGDPHPPVPPFPGRPWPASYCRKLSQFPLFFPRFVFTVPSPVEL